mmetsp:Transcript_64965/g.141575  ORF Transcript_64965/g.141575 Transcript_64965/m.141575 type:complete len:363 (+) Transcript_64965:666-1754(+)
MLAFPLHDEASDAPGDEGDPHHPRGDDHHKLDGAEPLLGRGGGCGRGRWWRRGDGGCGGRGGGGHSGEHTVFREVCDLCADDPCVSVDPALSLQSLPCRGPIDVDVDPEVSRRTRHGIVAHGERTRCLEHQAAWPELHDGSPRGLELHGGVVRVGVLGHIRRIQRRSQTRRPGECARGNVECDGDGGCVGCVGGVRRVVVRPQRQRPPRRRIQLSRSLGDRWSVLPATFAKVVLVAETRADGRALAVAQAGVARHTPRRTARRGREVVGLAGALAGERTGGERADPVRLDLTVDAAAVPRHLVAIVAFLSRGGDRAVAARGGGEDSHGADEHRRVRPPRPSRDGNNGVSTKRLECERSRVET